MSLPLRSIVAMIQVKAIAHSIDFYEKLGFAVGNTFTPDNGSEMTWASLQSDRAELMLSSMSHSESTSPDSVLFYIYCDDVAAKRMELETAGIPVGPVQYPFYSPKGEFRIVDPDGYVLMITHT